MQSLVQPDSPPVVEPVVSSVVSSVDHATSLAVTPDVVSVDPVNVDRINADRISAGRTNIDDEARVGHADSAWRNHVASCQALASQSLLK